MPQGMCQPASLRNVQQDCGGFGGHGSAPCGALSSPAGRGHRTIHVQSGLSVVVGPSTCETYKLQGQQSGGGTRATSLLVCVPAALRECRGHGLHTQAGNLPRATDPRNGGHQPEDWQAIFFNTAGNHEFFLDFRTYMSKLVWYFYFRAWYSGIRRRLWWFPSHRSASLLSSLVLSVPGVEVFRLSSSWALQVYTSWDPDSVPVTILLSSILFVTD